MDTISRSSAPGPLPRERGLHDQNTALSRAPFQRIQVAAAESQATWACGDARASWGCRALVGPTITMLLALARSSLRRLALEVEVLARGAPRSDSGVDIGTKPGGGGALIFLAHARRASPCQHRRKRGPAWTASATPRLRADVREFCLLVLSTGFHQGHARRAWGRGTRAQDRRRLGPAGPWRRRLQARRGTAPWLWYDPHGERRGLGGEPRARQRQRWWRGPGFTRLAPCGPWAAEACGSVGGEHEPSNYLVRACRA